jgi:hypothetical protein
MIAIKDMEMPIDCKQCPLMGVDGSPRDPFSPMMCIAIWATKRERKHCVEGKILDDCPLVEIVTCKDCKHNKNGVCPNYRHFVDDDFYCADAERR